MGNAPITMGLKTDKNAYQHGETMTGTVYLSVTSVDAKIQSYQGIQLSFSGEEHSEVRVKEENSGDSGTTYRTERETINIFHVQVPMTTFASPLRPANYEFPFEWTLPNTPLPSSFRNRQTQSGRCEVRYTLAAYVTPQDNTSSSIGIGRFLSCNSFTSKGTFASQTIQFVGAPTRAIPEPLYLAEERTTLNGLCCCWKQGDISLGWQADNIVLTPEAECRLVIRGSNASALPVSKLRVQLIQTIHWQAGGSSESNFQNRHTRSQNATLVDYYVDVGHLKQWHGTAEKSSRIAYQSVSANDNGIGNMNINGHNQEDDYFEDEENDEIDNSYPIPTSFEIPPDTLDSYQGNSCRIEHMLIVSAVTRMLATTPQVPHSIHIQRVGMGKSPAAVPVATAWMDETEYQDVVLPSNWAPDEKVPVIHLKQIATLDDEDGAIVDNPARIVTAEAVMVRPNQPQVAAIDNSPNNSSNSLAFARPAGMDPSAPLEDENFDFNGVYGDVTARSTHGPDLQKVFELLQEIDAHDLNTHHRIEHEIKHVPLCQKVVANMTPTEYQYLCRAANKATLHRVSFLLATELNKSGLSDEGQQQEQGFRGEYLVALMQLPLAQEISLSLIGSLTEQIIDLDNSASLVEHSLRPDDASWFLERVAAIRMRNQK